MKLIVPQPLITTPAVITKDDLGLGPVQADLIEDWVALICSDEVQACIPLSPVSKH